LFVDVPRHVDLQAIKRIGLVHWEFLVEGLSCALHVNGRSETDFRRWGAYVRARSEPAERSAASFIFDWLVNVAVGAGRPLELIVRGAIDALPRLWSPLSFCGRSRGVSR
jgi:hypothetical protein